jgi:hypothetical protein
MLSQSGKMALAPGSPDLVACSGAKIAEFTAAQKSNPAEWTSSDPRYDLVSFTFGGDDLGFADVVHQCLGVSVAGGVSAVVLAGLAHSPVGAAVALKAWEADPLIHCPSNTVLRQRIQAVAGGYKTFLESVAEEAVTAGGNIVVLGYPELVEDPKQWSKVDQLVGLCQGIRPADADELRGLAGDLNATIATTVAAVNAEHKNGVHLTYIDVNTGNPHMGIPYNDQDLFEPSSGARHNVCAAKEWINGITFNVSGLNPLDYFNRSFHPNQAGNNAMAALVDQVFPQLDWSHLGPASELYLTQFGVLMTIPVDIADVSVTFNSESAGPFVDLNGRTFDYVGDLEMTTDTFGDAARADPMCAAQSAADFADDEYVADIVVFAGNATGGLFNGYPERWIVLNGFSFGFGTFDEEACGPPGLFGSTLNAMRRMFSSLRSDPSS